MELSHEHGAAPARTLEVVTNAGPSHAYHTEPVCLSELISGLCKIEESVFTEQSCALVVTRSHRAAGGPVRPLSKRSAEILERSLIDGARKSVAMDLGLCPSSVAEILKHGFTFMGLSCWPSRIPLLLVMAAHAWRMKELERSATLLVAENQHFSQQTISATRPDNDFEARLTPAEFAVTRLLVEGKSYAEMAVLRRTSSRTVANQLAAAFHRLKVSGRAELLCLLAMRKVTSWRISTPISRISPFPAAPQSDFLRVASWQGR